MFNAYYSRYRSWRKNHQACKELMGLSYRQLVDIGIYNRQDIESIVRRASRSLSSANSG